MKKRLEGYLLFYILILLSFAYFFLFLKHVVGVIPWIVFTGNLLAKKQNSFLKFSRFSMRVRIYDKINPYRGKLILK